MNAQLKERLSALRIDMPGDLEKAHLERVVLALREAPAGAVRPVRPGRLRHRLASLAGAAMLVLVPGSAAIAAEDAVPGDLLYPVKQLTETVRSWFDPSVVADHRIDELETVIDRGDSNDEITERLRDAEHAVDDLDDPVVTDRLARVRDSIGGEEQAEDGVDSVPLTDSPRPPTPPDAPLRDETSTTSTIAPDDTTDPTSDSVGDRSFDGPVPDEPLPDEPVHDDPVDDEPPPADRSPGSDRRSG